MDYWILRSLEVAVCKDRSPSMAEARVVVSLDYWNDRWILADDEDEAETEECYDEKDPFLRDPDFSLSPVSESTIGSFRDRQLFPIPHIFSCVFKTSSQLSPEISTSLPHPWRVPKRFGLRLKTSS